MSSSSSALLDDEDGVRQPSWGPTEEMTKTATQPLRTLVIFAGISERGLAEGVVSAFRLWAAWRDVLACSGDHALQERRGCLRRRARANEVPLTSGEGATVAAANCTLEYPRAVVDLYAEDNHDASTAPIIPGTDDRVSPCSG